MFCGPAKRLDMSSCGSAPWRFMVLSPLLLPTLAPRVALCDIPISYLFESVVLLVQDGPAPKKQKLEVRGAGGGAGRGTLPWREKCKAVFNRMLKELGPNKDWFYYPIQVCETPLQQCIT